VFLVGANVCGAELAVIVGIEFAIGGGLARLTVGLPCVTVGPSVVGAVGGLLPYHTYSRQSGPPQPLQ